jgi:hypothetical protein
MHLSQPRDADYDAFADVVNDCYLDRQEKYPDVAGMFSRTAMVAADLSGTYCFIKRGMQAMVDLVFAIHLRSIGCPDDALYRRVIPPELADMRLEHPSAISMQTFLRILSIEPWRSWLERLRAQKQRSVKQLMTPYIGESLYQDVRVIVAASKLRLVEENAQRRMQPVVSKIARKSIIKSFKMFERLNNTSLLRRFLASASGGEPVSVEGHRYNYRIKMYPNTLIKLTINCNLKMTYMSTNIYSKQDEWLCQICHYFKQTPILDSVLATTLTVRNADTELEFLKAACVIEATRKFYDDPLLPTLKDIPDPVAAPGMIENIFRFADTYNNEPLRDLLYTRTLPLAYAAFMRIMRPGKRYMSVMRYCGTFAMWEIIIGCKEDNDDPFKIAQQAIRDNEF